MARIALVTSRVAEPLDDDLAPLATVLDRIEADTTIACWDDETVEWAGFDAVVLRSTWNYPERLVDFLKWARTVDSAAMLLNPLQIVRWNVDKAYLNDLGSAGVPTVPTVLIEPGNVIELPDSPEVVVKPSISAGSRDTARFDRNDPAATALVRRIWESGRTAMVQPYLTRVDSEGERAIVCFDGEPSHAFTKGALLRPGDAPTTDLFAAEEIAPATPSHAELEVAVAALEAIATRTSALPLYARIDLVPGFDSDPLVLEAELIEPSVYHHTDPASADRFATAILARVAG